jgi:hypothetical protein
MLPEPNAFQCKRPSIKEFLLGRKHLTKKCGSVHQVAGFLTQTLEDARLGLHDGAFGHAQFFDHARRRLIV